MKNGRSRYYGHRPPEIISYAVWVYHRFCLSFRDVEELLAERGIIVSYETIRIWCQKFGTDYEISAVQIPIQNLDRERAGDTHSICSLPSARTGFRLFA